MSNHERKGPQPEAENTALERAWKTVSDEQPPPALDAAIVAAARRAVEPRSAQRNFEHGKSGSRRWLSSWQPLAAAAGVAGLAFVLVQSLPREPTVRSTVPAQLQVQESVTSPDTAAVDTTAPQPDSTEGTGIASVPDPVEQRESMSGEAMAKYPAASGPEPAALPPSEADRAVATADATAVPAAAVTPPHEGASRTTSAAAKAMSAAPAMESRQDRALPSSPAQRAAHIAALVSEGDTARAADALRAFRADTTDADSYLPESLREWAATVK